MPANVSAARPADFAPTHIDTVSNGASALIATDSVPPLTTLWLPDAVMCGPPFEGGAAPGRRIPCDSVTDADATISSMLRVRADEGESGVADSVESLLHENASIETAATTAVVPRRRSRERVKITS